MKSFTSLLEATPLGFEQILYFGRWKTTELLQLQECFTTYINSLKILEHEVRLKQILSVPNLQDRSRHLLNLALNTPETPEYQATRLRIFNAVIELDAVVNDVCLARRRRADIYMITALPDKAYTDYEILCQLQPGNPRAWVEYGRALMVTDKWSQAEDCARRALAINATFESAQELLAICQRSMASSDGNR